MDNKMDTSDPDEEPTTTSEKIPETHSGKASGDVDMETEETKKNYGPSKDDFLAFKKPMLVSDSRPKLIKNVFEEPSVPKPPKDRGQTTQEPKKMIESEEQVKAVETKPELSPAEIQKLKEEAVPYKEPSWGTAPEDNYAFEILKNGTIIDKIDLKKSFYTFGRLPSCDVKIEHPSSSRYHAVVQYCGQKTDDIEPGWYIYDLDSTHGSWVNKSKVKPRVYVRIRVGHVAKFGGSTRLYILSGPESDQDEEKEGHLNKKLLELHEKKAEVHRQAEADKKEQEEKILSESSSCSWGIDFQESAEPEEEIEESLLHEETYIDDPKKALNSYFEREGMDLPEYEFIEAGFGKHHCRVELPIDDAEGKPVYAECIMTGKKKDVVVACALEACRTLDRMGELRKSSQESRKRKKKWEENDYYDSDEDTFLDRTGGIEKKRLARMRRAGKTESETETYNSLMEKIRTLDDEKSDIDKKMSDDDKVGKDCESEDLDALDSFMLGIKSGKMDPISRRKLKTRLHEIKMERAKLQKLADIAKPTTLT